MAKRFKPCAVDGCNKNAHWDAKGSRGWCSAHYNRWKRHGSVDGGGTTPGDARRYFEEVVASFDGFGCLIWPFARDNFGYAQIFMDGMTRRVPRLSCEARNGPPPAPASEAAHSCGNGHLGCVNPMHLRWATPEENSADKIEHGTANRGYGHVWAKTDEAMVRQIREMGANMGASAISRQLGIPRKRVSMILNRDTWAWLT